MQKSELRLCTKTESCTNSRGAAQKTRAALLVVTLFLFGCWVACPDPIDFRAYTVINIYEHKNAYYLDSQFAKTPRPSGDIDIPRATSL